MDGKSSGKIRPARQLFIESGTTMYPAADYKLVLKKSALTELDMPTKELSVPAGIAAPDLAHIKSTGLKGRFVTSDGTELVG